MSPSKAEIDQLVARCSEADLKVLLGELVKKFVALNSRRESILLRDCEDNPVGFLLPTEAIESPEPSDLQTLLAVARYRRENPPERYLTIEEFVASLSSVSK